MPQPEAPSFLTAEDFVYECRWMSIRKVARSFFNVSSSHLFHTSHCRRLDKNAEHKEHSDHGTVTRIKLNTWQAYTGMRELHTQHRAARTARPRKAEPANINGPQKYERNVSPKLQHTPGIRTTGHSETKAATTNKQENRALRNWRDL